jgi:hypothetical protein
LYILPEILVYKQVFIYLFIFGWALVAHACNASYSRGRDQEDHGSKPAQANSL